MALMEPEYLSDNFELKRLSSNILYIKYHVGHVSRALVEEVARVGFEMAEEQFIGIVSDFRGQALNMSTNAQKFVAGNAEINRRVLAQALLVDSLSISVKVGFFLNQYSTKTKMKAFHNYDDGLNWLKSLDYS